MPSCCSTHSARRRGACALNRMPRRNAAMSERAAYPGPRRAARDRASPSPISWASRSSGRCAWRSIEPCSCHARRPSFWSSGARAQSRCQRCARSTWVPAPAPSPLRLAHERPHWQITATDAKRSCACARTRQRGLALDSPQLEFLHGRWFEPLGGQILRSHRRNPPYVAEDDPLLSQPPLSFEPQHCADAGQWMLSPICAASSARRLRIWRAAAGSSWSMARRRRAEVARELVVRGFRQVRSQRDLAGHERMTEAQWGEPLPQEK